MTPLEFLQHSHLRQYPPQKRTILRRDNSSHLSIISVPVSFPCLSFGGIRAKIQLYGSQPSRIVDTVFAVVYCHERPWKDLDDALTIVKRMPGGFHCNTTTGGICLGWQMFQELKENKISVEEAFWFTANSARHEGVRYIHTRTPEQFMATARDVTWYVAELQTPTHPLGRVP